MNFLVDAQLPPSLAGWLRERGHQAEHVCDVGLLAATDAVLAAYAEANDAILVSKDDDFAALRLPDRFGLIWLRCGNASNRALFAWLQPRWTEIERLLNEDERFIEVR